MNHRAKQSPVREWLNNHSQVLVYICLVLVIVLGFTLDARNRAEDERRREVAAEREDRDRCEGGVDTREVLRSQVEAVYNLATSAVQRNADDPPLTANELRQYNQYIERANTYREVQYKKIKPSKPCLKYVDDTDVRPPTPPVPPLTNKEVRP